MQSELSENVENDPNVFIRQASLTKLTTTRFNTTLFFPEAN